MILEWLVGVSLGVVIVSALASYLIWRHERQSERAAPRKLALMVMSVIVAGWTISTALILLVAYAVTLLL